MKPSDRSSTPRSTLILRADQIAVGVAVAAVVVATIVAVSPSSRCGSYCCGPDRRSAIRIIPTAIGRSTVSSPAIGSPAVGGSTIGHTPARNANSAASDACRANPCAANTGTAATVSERVIWNKDCTSKYSGCEANHSMTQHVVLLS